MSTLSNASGIQISSQHSSHMLHSRITEVKILLRGNTVRVQNNLATLIMIETYGKYGS